MIVKLLLIISFVINCFNEIHCNRPTDDLSNQLIDGSDNSYAPNANYIEDVDVSTTDDSIEKCCNARGECQPKCLDNEKRSFEAMFLLTACEVILAAAFIMGVSALVTVLLRICFSRRYPRNAPNTPDEFGRNGQRVSLTSLQQRVLAKLRDRPPRYETRHNYEYQRRETNSRIPVLNPGASNIPPPSYENNDNNSGNELPPAYTIAIEDSGGILNPSFSCDESAITNQSVNSESDINSRNRTSDNILHI